MIRPRLSYVQFFIATILFLTLSGMAYAAPTVIYFNTTGTTSWTVPAGVTAVDYLVVAGGGGGGYNGGGGGAGGFTNGSFAAVSGSVTVTVVAGGAGSANANTRGVNGGNSVFGSFIALGGGGSGSGNNVNGLTGGSGGGAAGPGTPGSGTPGQGNRGGYGDTPGGSGNYWGGGGGGAGAVGGNATKNVNGGAGGDGTATDITGVSITYAGGGGGGAKSGTGGTGGTGGGGAGGVGAGSNGIPNTGGGGGGGGTTGNGGNGGSGVVIIRYILPTVTNVTPSDGPLEGGTNVTITGSGFTGVTQVRFGSTPATSYTFVSDTSILATSPPNATAGTVDVRVTTPYGTSLAVAGDTFTYSAAQLQIDVNGTISNWALEIGENIDTTNLTLGVKSSHGWSVTVYDALDLGKPEGTAGYMAEFDGSSYTISGRTLSSPVQVKNITATSYITVSGDPQAYLSGTATPAQGISYPIEVRQVIDYEDAILSPPSTYQIIVTFVGTSV